ncbi:Tetracyclin repressor, C-terminal all-alpha domain [Rubrobacter radiotolerans]|uniref:TetR/AcrR family transcriptional regulator C-terminal domain-containing protein n=1 Tax=Rubrobacter radiotolerans TaxID=42256 RepID=A0A023X3P9_RUBRA|nr:TetR/AcrR family transcriptional regulator C-terminal domain-containing protein [Rubrobacter radiotolerans]AHY47082.1 Tetracyclin repressor, C-terminal all-alpha domain [Rubrobacter radiotolerans]MDX5894487.1 TetR/AcrR family transcriptional regulator C-terminal domain-containing protein [Rubrobacter radiotolerans]SMC06105.1 transcriptional regulator, TetR family [Rubrobacter radiotolerans DSM 5868]
MSERRRLSRERVLEAAVSFVDREGLEALSMRKLGAELGVEAMSLYNHIPNKNALLDGMVEYVLGEMTVTRTSDSWEDRIREGYRQFRGVAKRHPNVFPLLVTRPPHFPEGVWLLERFLNIMEEAGFPPKVALHSFRILTNYTFGYSMSEIRGFALEPATGKHEFRYRVPDEYPSVQALREHLINVDHDREFEFGLDLIIEGMKQHL